MSPFGTLEAPESRTFTCICCNGDYEHLAVIVCKPDPYRERPSMVFSYTYCDACGPQKAAVDAKDAFVRMQFASVEDGVGGHPIH